MFVQVCGTYSLPYASSPISHTLRRSLGITLGGGSLPRGPSYATPTSIGLIARALSTLEREAHIEERVKTARAF